MKKINDELNIYSYKNYLKFILNKQGIIDCILENKKINYPIREGYNFEITKDRRNFFNNLYKKYYKHCKEYFKFTPSKSNLHTCWIYLSDKNSFAEVWHNHLKTSTINGVYYFHIPDNKTSIDFLDKRTNKIFNYKPVTNELLIFPNHLDHKPNRCYNDGYRISINMEILCEESSIEIFSKK